MVPLERYTASQALNHPWILRSGKEVPLTSFEIFKRYSEELKLKEIMFAVLFANLTNFVHKNTNHNHIQSDLSKGEDDKLIEVRSNDILKNRLNILKEEYEIKRLSTSKEKSKESRKRIPPLPPLNHPKIYKTARKNFTPFIARDSQNATRISTRFVTPLGIDSPTRLSSNIGSNTSGNKFIRNINPPQLIKRVERKMITPVKRVVNLF